MKTLIALALAMVFITIGEVRAEERTCIGTVNVVDPRVPNWMLMYSLAPLPS